MPTVRTFVLSFLIGSLVLVLQPARADDDDCCPDGHLQIEITSTDFICKCVYTPTGALLGYFGGPQSGSFNCDDLEQPGADCFQANVAQEGVCNIASNLLESLESHLSMGCSQGCTESVSEIELNPNPDYCFKKRQYECTESQ